MKKYQIKKTSIKTPTIKFYQNIFFSVIIFCVVVTLCKINPETNSYVKKVLNDSYDLNVVQKKTVEIVSSIKNKYKNVKKNFVWEE